MILILLKNFKLWPLLLWSQLDIQKIGRFSLCFKRWIDGIFCFSFTELLLQKPCRMKQSPVFLIHDLDQNFITNFLAMKRLKNCREYTTKCTLSIGQLVLPLRNHTTLKWRCFWSGLPEIPIYFTSYLSFICA